MTAAKPESDARVRQPLAPRDSRHGTANGYSNLGCRCDRCREAWRVYFNEYNHRAGRCLPREDYVYLRRRSAELRDTHGTETRYRLGCRCDACRAAAAACRRERRWANIEATRKYDRERKRAAAKAAR